MAKGGSDFKRNRQEPRHFGRHISQPLSSGNALFLTHISQHGSSAFFSAEKKKKEVRSPRMLASPPNLLGKSVNGVQKERKRPQTLACRNQRPRERLCKKEYKQNCNTRCKTTVAVPSDIRIIAFSIADFKRFSQVGIFLRKADKRMRLCKKGRPFGRPCGCAINTSPLLFACQIV